jgi:hypothetical protein
MDTRDRRVRGEMRPKDCVDFVNNFSTYTYTSQNIHTCKMYLTNIYTGLV